MEPEDGSESHFGSAVLDPESTQWVRVLDPLAADHEEGVARLHARLVAIARHELSRRSGSGVTGPEAADLAHQAAADALLAVIGKRQSFRGESRFTTWAYRFVVLEVSHTLARHYGRTAPVSIDGEEWDRLPDRLGLDPSSHVEAAELVAVVRRTVAEALTERQREVFVALVLDGVPLDALTERLGVTRGAVYKTMFDARRKIRAALVANGYLVDSAGDPGRVS